MPRWTAFQWAEECNYISNVTDKQGQISTFNFDTACFRRYCEMQANAAHEQGFYDSETYIRECIADLR